MTKQYFVTGIDTEVGKTISAAILVEALEADYWKPVQAGELNNSDTDVVRSLISNKKTTFHPETYRLQTPASPHYAAKLDGIKIDFDSFEIPRTTNNLIIEGAGGLFVPLNDDYLIIDLIQKLQIPVILVAKFYLGSINHTLSSIDALKKRNIEIAGIIFNGDTTESSKEFILKYSELNNIANFPWFEKISKKEVHESASLVRNLL